MFVDLYTRIGPERELIQHVEAVHPQHRQDMINILARRRGFHSGGTGPIPLTEHT